MTYKNPCPGGHEIYNFGEPFLGHHYYTLSSPDLCLGVEKMIFKKKMYFHYITYMATPQNKNPYSRGYEIHNFGKPFLSLYNYALSLSHSCPSIEEDFKRNSAVSLYDLYGHALPKNPCLRGREIYHFGRPFLGNHNYLLTLLFYAQEKRIFLKEIMQFHYIINLHVYGHAPAQEPLPRGSRN